MVVNIFVVPRLHIGMMKPQTAQVHGWHSGCWVEAGAKQNNPKEENKHCSFKPHDFRSNLKKQSNGSFVRFTNSSLLFFFLKPLMRDKHVISGISRRIIFLSGY